LQLRGGGRVVAVVRRAAAGKRGGVRVERPEPELAERRVELLVRRGELLVAALVDPNRRGQCALRAGDLGLDVAVVPVPSRICELGVTPG